MPSRVRPLLISFPGERDALAWGATARTTPTPVPSPMRTSVDPREIITPATVTVAPELLGLPLARPWRRGVAILIDLLLCAILVGLLEAPSVFLSVVATVIVWRL